MHVVPTDDLIDHDTIGDCVCGPREELVEGGWIVVHNSLDGRERPTPLIIPPGDVPFYVNPDDVRELP